MVGSLATGLDIHRIAMTSDFIFTGTRCGTIEVWLKDKISRVASIKMAGSHTKITSLVSDTDGVMLFVGSSGGKIQVTLLLLILINAVNCQTTYFLILLFN